MSSGMGFARANPRIPERIGGPTVCYSSKVIRSSALIVNFSPRGDLPSIFLSGFVFPNTNLVTTRGL
jgi:hypothetical protein